MSTLTKKPPRAKAKPAKTTARTGDPGAASRGAAVERAKRSLGDTIDRTLEAHRRAVNEANELRVLAFVAGISRKRIRPKLDVATLEEIKTWEARVAAMTRSELGKSLKASEPQMGYR